MSPRRSPSRYDLADERHGQGEADAAVHGDGAGHDNTAVIWKVNGITGGNGAVGTISASGLYKAPNSVPAGGVVTVSATSVADPSKSASATVTVTRK